jgi:hypothetical protein
MDPSFFTPGRRDGRTGRAQSRAGTGRTSSGRGPGHLGTANQRRRGPSERSRRRTGRGRVAPADGERSRRRTGSGRTLGRSSGGWEPGRLGRADGWTGRAGGPEGGRGRAADRDRGTPATPHSRTGARAHGTGPPAAGHRGEALRLREGVRVWEEALYT